MWNPWGGSSRWAEKALAPPPELGPAGEESSVVLWDSSVSVRARRGQAEVSMGAGGRERGVSKAWLRDFRSGEEA